MNSEILLKERLPLNAINNQSILGYEDISLKWLCFVLQWNFTLLLLTSTTDT